MSELLEKRVKDILKILADPTRRKILQLIQNNPLNPQIIAEKLNISRPAVEKHLKLLVGSYICERTVEPFPTPRYVYFVSTPGWEFMDAIKDAAVTFFQSMDGIVSAEIDQLERDFLLGRISRREYDARKKILLNKKDDLKKLRLTRIWIEDAKKIVNEYESKKSKAFSQ